MAKAPNISLPQGVRDILPEEAQKIGFVERTVLSVFEGYGFKRIITPLLEYVDVLSLGTGEWLRERVLKFVDPTTGRIMAIRPDITPQIARVVATRMRDCPLPLKLCYNENVLRYQDPTSAKSKELLQIGAEYITEEPSPEVDAEMIVMAVEALRSIGLEDFRIDIGDVGFVRAILRGLGLDEHEKVLLKDVIAKKDTSGLEELLKGFGDRISREERDILFTLTSLYGEEEIIERAMSFSRNRATEEVVENMHIVLEILKKRGVKGFITVDLGEVRGFDYYTGMIFEGFASGIGKPILSGGRYDTLIERFGYRCASTGFAFDVENIVSALNTHT